MAFPVPVELPDSLGFNSRVFDIGRYQQVSPGGVLYPQTIERAEPSWFAELGTPPLRGDRYDEVRAFLDDLEGGQGSALWYDPRRPMPAAYSTLPTTADPWTKTGEAAPILTIVSYANSELRLEKMENGAIVSLGDYISCLIGTVWYLWRVTRGAVVGVDYGPNAIVVKVKPRPNLLVGFDTLPAPIRYRKAPFEGKVIGAPKEDDSIDSNPKLSFKVFQFLNRTLP